MKFIKLTTITGKEFTCNKDLFRPVSFVLENGFTRINYRKDEDRIGMITDCLETPDEIIQLINSDGEEK